MHRLVTIPIRFAATCFIGVSLLLSCRHEEAPATPSRSADSLHVVALLERGDSLYAQRSGFNAIAQSMVYFDSANHIAARIKDTFLLAYTVYYMGNVYNAWNKEPQTTLNYYLRAYALFNSLPDKQVKAFQLRYIMAHAYDGEKLGDSLRCVQTIEAALHDVRRLPDSLRRQMGFLPDFAWVATNSRAYALAERVLNTIAPRERIVNDPATNNYLDHYYLTRSRIDVLGYGKASSPYLDSLRIALGSCGNRFDSAYYSSNLSDLYEATRRSEKALRFARLSEVLSHQTGQNDILSVLRQQLLDREVQAGREREERIELKLQRRNILLIGSALVLLLLGCVGWLWRRRRRETEERRRQRQFTRLLLQKEEEERRRIATDLHDGINHELLALKNNLLLHQPVGPDDVEDVITSVREVSRNLYPALFESVGLTASIISLCDRMTSTAFTTCDLQYEPVLSKEEELHVYRITQEALNNVARHAKADAAKIIIRSGSLAFYLEVKDNGKGFDTAAVLQAGDSFGLQSIRERAAAIRAALSVSSSPSGTVIQLKKACPL